MLNFLSLLLTFAIGAEPSFAENKCGGHPLVSNYKHFKSDKCLGLVLNSKDVPWKKPRRILLSEDESLAYITDMGGWDNRNSGVLWEVNLKTKGYKKIYQDGDWTHGLQKDSLGRLLVGDTDQVLRRKEDGSWQVLISGLPSEGSHPLSHFILLENNDLILNVGAPSNDCSRDFRGTHCAQRDVEGEVRLYSYKRESDLYDLNYHVLARGLRNSMALLFNKSSNSLYQAENNLDQFGIPEEFNVIPLNSSTLDFGWPFCFGMNEEYVFPNHSGVRPNAFKRFCKAVADEPLFLIPAHSAPLDMIRYQGLAHTKELLGSIVMGWHGHRRSQNYALVSYDSDPLGTPVFLNDGLSSFTPLVSGEGRSEKDLLRPVGLLTDQKGQIWFVDDIQKRVFIYTNSSEDSPEDDDTNTNEFEEAVQEHISTIDSVLWSEFETLYGQFYSVQTCTLCHGPNEIPENPRLALETFFKRGWLDMIGSPEQMVLIQRTSVDAEKAMPPPPERPFQESEPRIYEDLVEWLGKTSQ